MVKIRDQSAEAQNSNIQHFTGPKYKFLGYVPKTKRPHDKVQSLVGGMNEAGLCFMSLTSKCFQLDSTMARPHGGGSLQFDALGRCRNIKEFDALLDEWGAPLGAMCNIGVIDAEGGAAYYEFNGVWYTKYDVNDPAVAPDGWMVMTNFAWSGHGGGGFDRHSAATLTMKQFKKNADGKYDITPKDLYQAFGRSYANGYAGITSLSDIEQYDYFSVKGFMYHNTTCGMLTFESVPVGEDPKRCVLWTQLGYPVVSPAIPMVVSPRSTIPSYIYKEDFEMPDVFKYSYKLRDKYIFNLMEQDSRSFTYFSIKGVKECVARTAVVEDFISKSFAEIYDKWVAGKLSDKEFYRAYAEVTPSFYEAYLKEYPQAD